MQEVTDILLQFSAKHNLWEKTKRAGVEAIESYLKEEKAEAGRLFPKLTTDNFIFEKNSQKLTFWHHSQKSFVVSTKYNLFTDNQKEQTSPVGHYVLDVDGEGKVVDDWLVFE